MGIFAKKKLEDFLIMVGPGVVHFFSAERLACAFFAYLNYKGAKLRNSKRLRHEMSMRCYLGVNSVASSVCHVSNWRYPKKYHILYHH
ncbi:hypothetical protein V8C40DRAFT_149610 [Trichoderma camerunense]